MTEASAKRALQNGGVENISFTEPGLSSFHGIEESAALESLREPIQHVWQVMRPVIAAAMNAAGAIFFAVDFERLVLPTDFAEKPFGAVHRHERVLVAVGDQGRAGDVPRNAGHRVFLEDSPRLLVAHAAEQA